MKGRLIFEMLYSLFDRNFRKGFLKVIKFKSLTIAGWLTEVERALGKRNLDD